MRLRSQESGPSILGIDLSTKAIELVLIEESTNRCAWDHIELEGLDHFERLRNIPRKMPRWASGWYDDAGVMLVAVEAPFGRGQAGTEAKLNRVFGAIVTCVPPRVAVWEIAPHDWRRELELPGNAPKERCRERALELGACPGWDDQNAYDAFCVAYAARRIDQRSRGLEAA